MGDDIQEQFEKTHALAHGHMSPTMESCVKAEGDFDSDTKDNPVKLLSQTRTLMHGSSRSRHPFASLTNAIKRVVNVRMEDQETLINCNKKIKQAKDMLKSHTGTKTLDEFVAHAEECKKAEANGNTVLQQEPKDKAFNQWIAFLVTDDADHKKFGGSQSGLSSQ